MRVRPVILSGGGGTRLWPMSRAESPKQFLRVVGDETMFEATVKRCDDDLFSPLIVVTSEDQRFFVADQLKGVAVDAAGIILEPCARNTAAAVAVAALWCLSEGHDDPMLVMPSDHLIDDVAAFYAAVKAGTGLAADGNLITFGIPPSSPNTGYGYIKTDWQEGQGPSKVDQFVEKPAAATAAGYLADGGYYWNAGIFLFKPSALLEELDRHAPDSAALARGAMKDATRDGAFIRPNADWFGKLPNISIDHAVMEKTDRAYVLPVAMGWSDVGSWDAVWDVSPKDAAGNVVRGDVVAIDSHNSLIRAETDSTVAVVGLDRMMVVVTQDSALIAPLDRAQDARQVVEALRSAGNTRADEPAKVFRPWGSYQTMDKGERFQTKRLTVNPGARLSLQKHTHRSEHWVVVEGTAEVTVGDEVKILHENESTYIPAGEIHRLANPSEQPLHVIEVQCGTYLGEDDITRFDDNYGRK